MSMTRSEAQWIARVMHTISYLAFIDSCNTVVGAVEKSAGDDVIRAAQKFIEKLKTPDTTARRNGSPADVAQ
jgi:hypothetical protein